MSAIGMRARRLLESPWMNNVFRVVAIVSLLVGLSVGARQYRLTSSMTANNVATNQASAQRAEPAGADRKALDDMIKAIADARFLPPAEAGPAVSKAMDGYLAARAAADQQRQSNPLPAPPSERCA